MSKTFSKVKVITEAARRRRFTTKHELAVVPETMQPGMTISNVVLRHGLLPSLVFRWRQLMSEGGRRAVRGDDDVVCVQRVQTEVAGLHLLERRGRPPRRRPRLP